MSDPAYPPIVCRDCRVRLLLVPGCRESDKNGHMQDVEVYQCPKCKIFICRRGGIPTLWPG